MSEDTTQNLTQGVATLILARLDSIDGRLGNLEQRVERLEARAYDTKPIWERALAEIVQIGKRLDSIDRRLSILNDDMLDMRSRVRRLDDRVTEIEESPSRA